MIENYNWYLVGNPNVNLHLASFDKNVLKRNLFDGKPQKKWTFEFLLVPKFKFTTVCLVSQLADFAIGGIFSGPKISQFRELTVQIETSDGSVNSHSQKIHARK